jgi:glucose uptake protein GlcU
MATLAAALFCFPLIAKGMPYVGTALLLITGARGMAWGFGQIAGYRRAKRDNIELAPPDMGTALGCVLIGLVLAAATALMFFLAPSHQAYALATGAVAFLCLSIGAVVGIREQVWR